MNTTHRAHDYQHLARRWRAVTKMAGLKLQVLAKAGDLPVFWFKTPAMKASGGIYISAGIHGDEPAATEALIAWAELNWKKLSGLPLMIFPCLNPYGLSCNVRTNESGVDLNRCFHTDEQPVVAALKKAVGDHRFTLSLMLHEDYEGQGLYLYELLTKEKGLGEELLKAGSKFIPLEPRTNIDGTKAVGGLIRRRFTKSRFDRMGYPEAIWLYLSHGSRAFTVETPSEFALDVRTRALRAVIEECVALS